MPQELAEMKVIFFFFFSLCQKQISINLFIQFPVSRPNWELYEIENGTRVYFKPM